MPVVNLAPIARKQYLDSNGDPVVGGKLFTYAAGSSTKQATYTDSTGTTANTNPIILDASGRTPYGVWYEAGKIYKEVLALSTDTDPPGSPIYTADVLQGVNDTTTPAALAASSQWVASGLTPTYVNATQFTLDGDQRAAFHVGRRLRLTVTAGTVYGYISDSAFTTLTTLTVVLDSGALDSGLSAVDVGILTALNQSMPEPSSVGFQPLDATTTALAGTLTAANKIPYATALNTAGELTLSTSTSLGTSDTTLSSQKAVKTYVDTQVATAVADSDFTGSNQSLTSSGYQKLPGGLIIQWAAGAAAASGTSQTITFPISFPTSAYRVIASAETASVAGNATGIQVRAQSFTTTSVSVDLVNTLATTNDNTVVPVVFAIGE